MNDCNRPDEDIDAEIEMLEQSIVDCQTVLADAAIENANTEARVKDALAGIKYSRPRLSALKQIKKDRAA